jgi:hypothetical protein
LVAPDTSSKPQVVYGAGLVRIERQGLGRE